MGKKFGWHSGKLTCNDLDVQRTINLGTLDFGAAELDSIVIKGRMSTSTLAGAALSLGASYTYGEAAELRYDVSSWTGIGNSFNGLYVRTSTSSANASGGLQGAQIMGVFNVTTGTTGFSNLKALYTECLIKANSSGNKTITNLTGVEANVSIENYGSTTLTFTNNIYCLYAKAQTGTGLADYTKVCGIKIAGRDDGNVRVFGIGLDLSDPEATVCTWTTGISITTSCTTGISLATGTFTTGLSIAGATTTGINVTGNATDGIKIQTGTFTDAIEIAGTTTNAINISGTSVTTGISITGSTTAISESKTLSSQTTENAYNSITFATDSTYITGTDITYSGARGSSAIKISGTWTGASGGYSNIYSLVTASTNWTGSGDGTIGIKSVVLSSGVAITDGNLYAGQFIAKKAGAGTATAQVAIIGLESWFYETDSSEVDTGIGGNFGWHADSTDASHVAGSVWRGVQIFCDSTGTSAAEETSGLCVWSQGGTLGNGIQLTPSNTITTGLRFVGGGAISTGIKFGGTAIGGASNLTITKCIDFDEASVTPDATRSKMIISFGSRAAEKTIDITGTAGQAWHLDPVQMNVNITCSTAPDTTSTWNMYYLQMTHDTTNMSNLRLKGSDWTITVAKNVQDVYVYQGEVDVTGNSTIGGELCGIGLTVSVSSGTVTGNVWGQVIAIGGASIPSTSSAGLFISARGTGTVTSSLYIESNVDTSVTNAIKINNVARFTNMFLLDAVAGFVAANALVPATAPDATTMGADACLKVLIGAVPYYIPLYDTLHA
jgi:hypothetical protein